MLFQNILFILNNLLHAMAVLGYLPKLKMALGLLFSAYFKHTFSIKMFLTQYSIN